MIKNPCQLCLMAEQKEKQIFCSPECGRTAEQSTRLQKIEGVLIEIKYELKKQGDISDDMLKKVR